MPVARYSGEPAVVVRRRREGIGRVLVDRVQAGEQDRIVVVVELPGEEEGAGEAVVLRAVMSVVLVGRDGVAPEAGVAPDVERQAVVMAEQDAFAITAEQQLRRNRSVAYAGSATLGAGRSRRRWSGNVVSQASPT